MLSSPAHNRPLVPRVELLARGIRAAAAQVESSVFLPFEELYRPTRSGLGFTLSDSDMARRSAWALIGEWLVAASLDVPCVSEGLAATHEWFWRDSGRALGCVPDVAISLDIGAVELRALLPYVLDPMAAATRRHVLNGQSSPRERQIRKATGVYYTPGDVAHLMVDRVRSHEGHAEGAERWLDPAHGSGVFLRAVFSALGRGSDAADRIYGVDLDPIAAETASFVLTAEDLAHNSSNAAPWERWHRFRRNLATGDALLIDTLSFVPAMLSSEDAAPLDGHPLGSIEPWRLQTVFPETTESGFARVVANPPYAPLQRTAASSYIPRLHRVTGRSARQDISPIFVELCSNILSDDGALAIVMPLSIVTSTRPPFPELRQHLADQPGLLELLSFDRAPDALFGDDIKTRNAIVHMNRRGCDDLVTSPLYRWTSRNRANALGSIPIVSVAEVSGVPETIPKVGTEWERELLQACGNWRRYLADWHTRRRLLSLEIATREVSDNPTHMLALAPTAYNFLNTIREPLCAVADGHDSQNGFAVLTFSSEQQASAAYALLSSHLAFWLWHVTGDGFHVTNALLSRLPVPLDDQGDEARVERLAELGDSLWKTAQVRPVRSTNRGRTTVSYPTWTNTQLIDEIDAEIGEFIGKGHPARLVAWYEQLVVVDLDSERHKLIGKKRP